MKEINLHDENDKYRRINNEQVFNRNTYRSTFDDDHYEPTVRVLNIRKLPNGSCGFHLTRTKWDPYPWVSAVDAATPAERCGLKAGDCVLEVNGEDVLGLRIKEIACIIQAASRDVTLLLWNSGCVTEDCSPESLCRAPMPSSLQRLSVIVQSVLSIIECPICLDTICPPVMQCQNGHLICVDCRIKSITCPVCRDRYSPRRALIAEEIYTNITNAFKLCRNEDKLRQKLFVPKTRRYYKQYEDVSLQQSHKRNELETAMGQVNKFSSGILLTRAKAKEQQQQQQHLKRNDKQLPANKFLQKLLQRKTYSMDNLLASPMTATQSRTTTKTIKTTAIEEQTSMQSADSSVLSTRHPKEQPKEAMTMSCAKQLLLSMTNVGNHLTAEQVISSNKNDIKCLQALRNGTSSSIRNRTRKLRKHYSHSINDLSSGQQVDISLLDTVKWHSNETDSGIDLIHDSNLSLPENATKPRNSVPEDNVIYKCLKATTPCTCYAPQADSSHNRLLYLGKRRPCIGLKCEKTKTDTTMTTNSAKTAVLNAVIDDAASLTTAANLTMPNYSTSSLSTFESYSNNNSSSVELLTTMNASAATTVQSTSPSASAALSASSSILSLSSFASVTPSLSSIAAADCHSEAPVVGHSSSMMTLKSLSSDATASKVTTINNFVASSYKNHKKQDINTRNNDDDGEEDQQCAVKHLQLPVQLEVESRYSCPCFWGDACAERFDSSSALQQHIKASHPLPIMSFGTSKAQLALPLRKPMDNAILILELSNQQHHQRTNEVCQDIADVENKEILETQKVTTKHSTCCTECWLRLKLNGQEGIELSVVFQTEPSATGCDLLISTRAS